MKRRGESERTELRRIRCAVYTRKSTEENLDTEFNSLDAQREAAEAYIASQREQGWVAMVVAIARADRWKELIEGGRYATVAEMAAAMGMDVSYVARILRLSLLAPDIVEAIMRGDEPDGLSLARLLDIPPYWPEQRKKWGFPPW